MGPVPIDHGSLKIVQSFAILVSLFSVLPMQDPLLIEREYKEETLAQKSDVANMAGIYHREQCET